MDFNDNLLALQLTAGELFCVAGLLGFSYLTLDLDPYQGWNQGDIQTDIIRGRHVLEEKGLIRPQSSGEVEIDDLLYVLIRWLFLPDYSIAISVFRKNFGETRRTLYYKNDQVLQMEQHIKEYRFTIFRQVELAIQQFYDWMEIKKQISSEKREIQIPGSRFNQWEQYFRGGCPDSLLPAKAISAEISYEFMLWLASQLEFISTLTLTLWEESTLKERKQRIYMGNASYLWQVSYATGDENGLLIQSISANEIIRVGIV